MNINPKIAQAKAALNKNLAVTQSKLAKAITERDSAKAKIQAAVDRAEVAERSARDVERDLKKANALLHRFLTNREAEVERLRDALQGLIDFVEIDKLEMNALALSIARSALSFPSGDGKSELGGDV